MESPVQANVDENCDMQTVPEDNVPGEGAEEADSASEAEVDSVDEDAGDEMDSDARRVGTISCLENLALSFLSQLTASVKPKSRGDSSDSQPDVQPVPKRIVLELANRGKPKSGDGDSGIRLRSIAFPKKGSGPSAKAPAQLLKVANETHEALVNECPMTKRDLYYRDVSLFKGQGAVDLLVDDLAATFSIARSDLNIRASSKGLFCGSALSIHLHDGTVIIGHDVEASLIPHAQDIAEFEISQEIAWILVIEKDAVFQTLRCANLTNHSSLAGHGLLITGKGYPDLATRQLLKTLSDNMPETTRFLALVDADAYGLDIVSVYKYGSVSMRHENATLAAPRLEWIGVSASEALGMGVDRDSLLPITVHDRKKAMTLLEANTELPPEWKRELMQMLHTQRKAEIEVLWSLPNITDAKNNQRDEDSNAVAHMTKPLNPVIRYVIWKINKVVNDRRDSSSYLPTRLRSCLHINSY